MQRGSVTTVIPSHAHVVDGMNDFNEYILDPLAAASAVL